MALEIRNLSRKFQQGERELYALKDLNLSVGQGDFINITGRSGSGKSTLLNLIAGLLRPTEGDILWNGKVVSQISDEESSRFRNDQIGYVMQGNAALANLTVWENVCLPWYIYPREGDVGARATKLLEQVGIAHLRDAYPSRLSGGEIKRMSIARALINGPEILLADEPTGDLDKENTEEIMRLFREIANQGTTVIVVTHELDTLRYGDLTYSMEQGRLSVQDNTI